MLFTLTYNEKDYDFYLPYDAGEIKFSQYIDYITLKKKYFSIDEDTNEMSLNNDDEYIPYLIEAIQVICGEGEYWKDIPISEPSDLDIIEDVEYFFDYEREDLTIYKLYTHINNILTNPDIPEVDSTYGIKYKGEEYFLNYNEVVGTFLGKDMKYNTGEVLTILEAQRLGNQAIERHGDPNGSIEFTVSLNEMAVLLRKKGEVLPSSKQDRDKFINSRSALFADLTMDVVFICKGFFFAILTDYLTQTPTSSSLKESQDKVKVLRKIEV